MKQEDKMEEKDRGIWVADNRLYLDEDNILHVIRVGVVDKEAAIEIASSALKLVELVDGKVKILTDLNRAGGSSSGARKVYQEMLEHVKLDRLALCGLHPVARVIASFTMGVTKKRTVRFFTTKAEALAWLKD
jgi:hypothetical protein